MSDLFLRLHVGPSVNLNARDVLVAAPAGHDEWAGLWWHSEDESAKVPGVLRLARGEISVTLIVSDPKARAKASRMSPNSIANPWGLDRIPALHGVVGQEAITLWDVFARHSRMAATEGAMLSAGHLVVSAASGVWGTWAPPREQFLVRSLSLRSDELDDFMDGHGEWLSDDLPMGSTALHVQPARSSIDLKIMSGTSQRAEMRNSVRTTWKSNTVHFGALDSGLTLEEVWLQGASPLLQFVSVSLVRPFTVREVWVTIDDHPDRLPLLGYTNEAEGAHRRRLPFARFRDLTAPSQTFDGWWDLWRKSPHGVGNLSALAEGGVWDMHHRILLAGTALESLSNALLPKAQKSSEDAEVLRKIQGALTPEQWAANQDRLKGLLSRRLAERAREVAALVPSGTFERLSLDADDWAQSMTRVRNSAAHATTRFLKYKPEYLASLVGVTQMILTSAIFEHLGESALARRVEPGSFPTAGDWGSSVSTGQGEARSHDDEGREDS